MKYAVQPKPLLGPCPCSDCGVPLWWARRLTTVLSVQVGSLRWREWNGHLHRCVVAPARQRRYNGRRKEGRYPQLSNHRHEAIHHGFQP